MNFSSLIPKMLMFILAILLIDHIKFTLILGPKIPGSYAILFFLALDFASTSRHFHNWASFLLQPKCFILSAIALHSSPVAYWRPSNLEDSSSGIISFCLFILFMGFSWQEYWISFPFPPPVNHVLSYSALWPICLEWPCMACLIASLSYADPFTMIRLWSINGKFHR